MAAFMLRRRLQLQRGLQTFTVAERAAFEHDGFVMKHDVLDESTRASLVAEFDKLFAGEFSTGVYPDEWHWRRGISHPDAFREIVNGWKASTAVAAVACSDALGRMASDLVGWATCGGARLAQDDVLWKPAGAAGVGFHVDGTYISDNFVAPDADTIPLSVTIWISLDGADADTGSVQYALGSHRWAQLSAEQTGAAFFGDDGDDVQAPARRAAEALGESLDVITVDVPPGGAVFHHERVWHGSSRNRSPTRPRRALGVHLLRCDARFRTDIRPGYIYGRYVLDDQPGVVRDEFFPIVWQPGCQHDVS